jgi:uncharacterized protein with NRDE domain
MCLILFAYRVHPLYPLILAANRDEFHDRPAAPASFWDTAPKLLAGKDLPGGGTWLGVTTDGRIAALSNYLDPFPPKAEALSRGVLASEFLLGRITPDRYREDLRTRAGRFNGFSLLFGDENHLSCYSNRGEVAPRIQPGIHGLSNHLLDTPWPKVVRGKEMLGRILESEGKPSVEEIFSLLADRREPLREPPSETEITPERERRYSRLFITGSGYGTRSSTLVMFDRDSVVTFIERTFSGSPDKWSSVSFSFEIERA